jgi:hypothetical protein
MFLSLPNLLRSPTFQVLKVAPASSRTDAEPVYLFCNFGSSVSRKASPNRLVFGARHQSCVALWADSGKVGLNTSNLLVGGTKKSSRSASDVTERLP